MKLAAIDIGSNSIKLVVVDAHSSESFTVLSRDKEVVQLGHETLMKGHLGRAAIDRAVDCIARFRSTAEQRGVKTILASATAAVREANNSLNFIRAVEQKAGVKVEILSGIEEARLIGLAASQGCSGNQSTNLNIDIGGGSTELSLFREGQPLKLLSMRLGAIGLTERFLTANPPRPKELENLGNEIRAALQRPTRELHEFSWDKLTGTSGTILALSAALKRRGNETGQPRESDSVDGVVNLERLASLNETLARMTTEERQNKAGISQQRAAIIVAGGQILEGAMRALQLKSLRPCEWSLREGVIINHLREWEDARRPPLPDPVDQKLRGVRAVGKRFRFEEAHAHQVARLAEKLFDSLADSEQLKRHDRLMLSAASLLHDVGYHIAHDSHHKHTLYLIRNSELTGFSEYERAVIANIARYHRGSLPKEYHQHFTSLNPPDREIVIRLASILRLADAFDRRHDSRVQDVSLQRDRRAINITLLSASECDTELIEARRRVGMFEEAFSCALQLDAKVGKATSRNPK